MERTQLKSLDSAIKTMHERKQNIHYQLKTIITTYLHQQ